MMISFKEMEWWFSEYEMIFFKKMILGLKDGLK